MFSLGDLNTIFQTFSSIRKWQDDKKAMMRYGQLLSDQENNPACLYFSPTDSEDRKIFERLLEKGLLERSRGFVGHYQIVGR